MELELNLLQGSYDYLINFCSLIKHQKKIIILKAIIINLN